MNRARVLTANRPRLIREFVTNWLLRRFLQESHGGFPAAYHNCGTKPTEKILARNGLETITKKVYLYQSHCYSSFLPIYLISLGYALLTNFANLNSIAASVCLIAEKR